MFLEFEYFIKNNCPEPIQDVLTQSLNLLEHFNVEVYQEQLMNLITSESNIERSLIGPDFISIVTKYLDSLLNIHGIVVSEEANLEFKNHVLQTILDLSNYIDSQTILDILELQEESIEKFTQILELFLPYSNSYIFSHLEEVQYSLLAKIKEITLRQLELDTTDSEEEKFKNDIIFKLRILSSLLKDSTLLGFKLIESGVSLGLSFTFYAKQAVRHFDQLNPEQVAKELIVLLAMSFDGHNNPIMTYRTHSQNIFIDLDRITKIDVHLLRLFAEYDKYKLALTIQNIENKQ